MYIQTHTHTHTHIYTHTSIYTHIYIHTHTHTHIHTYKCESESLSVMSDSLRPHGRHSPWNSPGRDTEVGSLSLLQGIFPTQGQNPGLPNFRQILYQMNQKGSLRILEWVAYPFASELNPRIEPGSPALQADSLPTELSGKPTYTYICSNYTYYIYLYIVCIHYSEYKKCMYVCICIYTHMYIYSTCV